MADHGGRVEGAPHESREEASGGARHGLTAPSALLRSRGRLILSAAAVVGAVVALRSLDTATFSTSALDGIRGLSPWGPIIFVGLYVAATVLFLPGSILTLGAGAVFVGLMRLSPVFPFNVLNDAFGVTRVRLRDHVLAFWVGMGFLATAAVTVYVTRLARAALARRLAT